MAKINPEENFIKKEIERELKCNKKPNPAAIHDLLNYCKETEGLIQLAYTYGRKYSENVKNEIITMLIQEISPISETDLDYIFMSGSE